LLTTRHRCNLDVWALVQSRGVGRRSLVTPEKVLSEYNKDLIFYLKTPTHLIGKSSKLLQNST